MDRDRAPDVYICFRKSTCGDCSLKARVAVLSSTYGDRSATIWQARFYEYVQTSQPRRMGPCLCARRTRGVPVHPWHPSDHVPRPVVDNASVTPDSGPAAESNERYRYLLSQGVNGLSVAFDLPTQMGYDSDHALAAGEVGKVGVAIDSIEDMAALFDGIPLDPCFRRR